MKRINFTQKKNDFNINRDEKYLINPISDVKEVIVRISNDIKTINKINLV